MLLNSQPFRNDVSDGRGTGAGDPLASFNRPSEGRPVRRSAVAVPVRNAARQDALHCTPVEGLKNLFVEAGCRLRK